jgi:hypothetical protein
MRYRTGPSNDIRLVTDTNGYAETGFSYEAASGVLIVPEFADFDLNTPVGKTDISCTSLGVELPLASIQSGSANQMYALETAEVADISCTIMLNMDRLGSDEVDQLPNTGTGVSIDRSGFLATDLVGFLVITVCLCLWLARVRRQPT